MDEQQYSDYLDAIDAIQMREEIQRAIEEQLEENDDAS